MKFKYNLSDIVKDNVTDFSGVITARTEYIIGEPLYLLEAKVDNKPVIEWFPEGRLEAVTE